MDLGLLLMVWLGFRNAIVLTTSNDITIHAKCIGRNSVENSLNSLVSNFLVWTYS